MTESPPATAADLRRLRLDPNQTEPAVLKQLRSLIPQTADRDPPIEARALMEALLPRLTQSETEHLPLAVWWSATDRPPELMRTAALTEKVLPSDTASSTEALPPTAAERKRLTAEPSLNTCEAETELRNCVSSCTENRPPNRPPRAEASEPKTAEDRRDSEEPKEAASAMDVPPDTMKD